MLDLNSMPKFGVKESAVIVSETKSSTLISYNEMCEYLEVPSLMYDAARAIVRDNLAINEAAISLSQFINAATEGNSSSNEVKEAQDFLRQLLADKTELLEKIHNDLGVNITYFLEFVSTDYSLVLNAILDALLTVEEVEA